MRSSWEGRQGYRCGDVPLAAAAAAAAKVGYRWEEHKGLWCLWQYEAVAQGSVGAANVVAVVVVVLGAPHGSGGHEGGLPLGVLGMLQRGRSLGAGLHEVRLGPRLWCGGWLHCAQGGKMLHVAVWEREEQQKGREEGHCWREEGRAPPRASKLL